MTRTDTAPGRRCSGCSFLERNLTQAAPNRQRSTNKTARQEKPSLPPAGAHRDPKSIACSPPAPGRHPSLPARSGQAEGLPAREPGQQDGHRSSTVCRRGRCQACQPRRELSMHQAAPSRCPALSGLLTPSERGSSPLLWPEEYRLTYSPSPASSLAFSL